MGDHEVRGLNAPTAADDRNEDRDDWRDEQVTVVEKRIEKTTTQGMPPLARILAAKQDK